MVRSEKLCRIESFTKHICLITRSQSKGKGGRHAVLQAKQDKQLALPDSSQVQVSESTDFTAVTLIIQQLCASQIPRENIKILWAELFYDIALLKRSVESSLYWIRLLRPSETVCHIKGHIFPQCQAIIKIWTPMLFNGDRNESN